MRQIMAFGPYLKSELQNFIKHKMQDTASGLEWEADFLQRLQSFAASGKLLRGSLLCFSYGMFTGITGEPDKEVIKAAMALELAHSGLLIHDDVMDKDDLRRGQPSLHRQYSLLAADRKLGQKADFGANMAVCGGDMSFFLAFALLAEINAEPDITRHINRLFTECLTTVCAGQMQDIFLEASSSMPLKKDIFNLMRAKTAAYTLVLPLTMGAAMAGQKSEVIETLRGIGEAAGIIFQIRDDELGALGMASETGKPVGSDVKEGKKTLLYYYLMKLCDAREREFLNSAVGNPSATAQDIKKVKYLLGQYKIPELLNNDVKSMQTEALSLVAELKVPSVARDELESLLVFCAERQA